MKQRLFFLLVWLYFFQILNCQSISLDSLKTKYTFKKYSLNTRDIYPFDKNIELYNFFLNDTTILLVSILPNIENEDNWLKTNEEIQEMSMECFFKSMKNDENNKKFGFSIVNKREKDGNYLAYASLVELFVIDNKKQFLNNNINTKQSPINIKKFIKTYKNKTQNAFPLNIKNIDLVLKNQEYTEYKLYLSDEISLKFQKAYKFWTFSDWKIIDGYNYQKGIDRFIYIPKFGIVGGSYDFYFALKPNTIFKTSIPLPISEDYLWKNIIKEKVMLANELK